MSDSRARFAHDTARVFGGQLVMTVIGVGTGMITARMLGPHDRGLFQMLVMLPTMLSNFAKFGIPQASVYAMRRRGASPSAVVTNALWFALVFGVLMALVCYAGRDWLLARVIKGAPESTLLPMLALLPFVLLQVYLLGIVQGLQRFGEYNFQQIVPNLLALIGMAVVLVWLRAGLLGAVLTQAGIAVFVTIWLALRVHRLAPLGWRFDARLGREMLAFGGKSYVQTLAATLHLRIDQYMIGYLLDPAQVGLYAVAVNMTNLLLRVPDALGTVLFPRLTGAAEAQAHAATAEVTRLTVALVALGGFGLAVVGPVAIPLLFGERFAGSVAPMLMLLPGIVMMSLYLILSRNFTSRNRQQINIVAAVLALVLNVGANLWLVPRWGIVGAALSSCLSYGVAAMVLLAAFVRDSGVPVPAVLWLKPAEVVAMLRQLRQRVAASR
ncbi:MAG TPA: flippase [Candidatus Limnocylindria bacterium]|nr:flippase [Candidatus Limnocylindria bacterium]